MQGRGVECVRFTICIRAGQVRRMQGVNGLLQILGPEKNRGPVQPHGPHTPWARACNTGKAISFDDKPGLPQSCPISMVMEHILTIYRKSIIVDGGR